ncbi:MAG: tyrosine-type recombinase/integrase [Kiritimatiellaeota bacterium]|nr:tyrosine-type recombinase/integrase [Kiritimatiellota bacterium]
MSTSYRRKWLHKGAIIRQRGAGYQVEINEHGKRHRKTFAKLIEAQTHIEQKLTELTNRGTAAFALSDKQRLEATEAFQRLGAVPLVNAVDFYLRHHQPVGGTRTVKELLAEYLEAKTNAGRRPDTLTDIKCRIGKLAEKLGNRPVHTITTAELTGWLDHHRYQGVSRANYKRVIAGFFRYAVKKGLLEKNPATDIEKVKWDEALPGIFSVTETDRLLKATVTIYPRLLPATAIGSFAGLRATEIEKLDWSAIDFDARLITVRPEVAKKRRQRHVAMSDNLFAWLLPYRRASGPVCPPIAVIMRWRPRIMKEAKLSSWPRNGLRHSFASYHLAKLGDMNKTALELGHTRPDILFNHYRNLVRPEEALAYWELRPPAGQEPLPTGSNEMSKSHPKPAAGPA